MYFKKKKKKKKKKTFYQIVTFLIECLLARLGHTNTLFLTCFSFGRKLLSFLSTIFALEKNKNNYGLSGYWKEIGTFVNSWNVLILIKSLNGVISGERCSPC